MTYGLWATHIGCTLTHLFAQVLEMLAILHIGRLIQATPILPLLQGQNDTLHIVDEFFDFSLLEVLL